MRSNRQTTEELKSWLRAEAHGDDETAEKILASLFNGLPQSSPGARFADRVLAQAGIRRRASGIRAPDGLVVPKWTIAAGLSLAGGLFVLALPLWLLLFDYLSPSALISGPVQLWAGWVDHLTLYAPAWRVVVDLWRAAWLVVTSWPVVLVGLSCILFSLLGGRFLVGSSFFGRRLDYA